MTADAREAMTVGCKPTTRGVQATHKSLLNKFQVIQVNRFFCTHYLSNVNMVFDLNSKH